MWPFQDRVCELPLLPRPVLAAGGGGVYQADIIGQFLSTEPRLIRKTPPFLFLSSQPAAWEEPRLIR